MIKCGIIGCGRNVEDLHIPALDGIENCTIHSVCDLNEERAKTFAFKYGVEKVYSNTEEYLQSSRDLDFLIVSTPGFTHYEICNQAVELGYNLLVEKPVTLSLQDTLKLKNKVDEKGTKFGVIQNYRYREPVIEAKKALDEGLIGEVRQVNCVFHGQTIFNEPTQCSWQERKNKVLIYEMMVHLLDLEVYFAGPVKQILGHRVIVDEKLNCTRNIYVIAEHENGATGLLDLQLFSSSNYMGLEVFGSANDVKIKFQPHYYRIYSGNVNPLDELYLDVKRIFDFAIPAFKEKLFKPKVTRRAASHYILMKQYVDSLLDPRIPMAVTLDDVIPTMEFAQMLSDLVYDSPT